MLHNDTCGLSCWRDGECCWDWWGSRSHLVKKPGWKILVWEYFGLRVDHALRNLLSVMSPWSHVILRTSSGGMSSFCASTKPNFLFSLYLFDYNIAACAMCWVYTCTKNLLMDWLYMSIVAYIHVLVHWDKAIKRVYKVCEVTGHSLTSNNWA